MLFRARKVTLCSRWKGAALRWRIPHPVEVAYRTVGFKAARLARTVPSGEGGASVLGVKARLPLLLPIHAILGGAAAVAAGAARVAQAEAAPSVDPRVLQSVLRAQLREKKDLLLRLVPKDLLARLKQSFPTAELRDLARFAIACSFDFVHARNRFRNHLEWRERVLPTVLSGPPTLDLGRMDEAADDELIAEFKTGKMVIHGRDREGRPLMVWDSTRHDPAITKPESVLRMVVYLLEAAVKERMGDEQHQVTMVIYTPQGESSASVRFGLQLVKGAAQLVRVFQHVAASATCLPLRLIFLTLSAARSFALLCLSLRSNILSGWASL